ncbi:MAG: hypothetical protein JNK37_10525 [Verrucomicrobiales bacterium]|nr:hypothetical protein [Verrucomicrobiales bacterium]
MPAPSHPRLSPTLPRLLSASLLLVTLPACMTQQPQIGGFSSLVADPAHILKDEPPPVKPNPHMDPIPERVGAFSLRWVEDLEKTATNNEPDPDDARKKS